MSNNSQSLQREGALFVISAPSGAGKTSLCKEIVDIIPGLRHSVSYTTRPMRKGEVDGVDYHFVDADVFAGMVAADAFAEWAEVHGNRYGTALATLDNARQTGCDLLLDIDCQGAIHLKAKQVQGVNIFILPPSMPELERRLRERQTDSDAVIERRIVNARGEIAQAGWYDYWVFNDDFNLALEQLKSIITAETCRAARYRGVIEDLLR
ncbi:MAG: guanylate kinase [Desulfuromonadales bacterium]|nr:guanylate kinase [Desulfuromonadales bacterium]